MRLFSVHIGRQLPRKARLLTNVKVRGPEAALSPEAPSRLTGSAAAGPETGD